MLRAFVLALGVVIMVIGAGLCLFGGIYAPGVQFLIFGVIVVAGVIFERWRYRRADSRPPAGAGWQRTAERFVDPESGVSMEVFYNPETGERRYVESGN